MKKIEFRGKEYKSLEDFFLKNKEIIPFKAYVTLKSRLNEGLTLEEAIKKGKKKTGKSFGPYVVEGVAYRGLPDVAKEYGITERAIYKRYSRGKRGDDLVPKKKRKDYVEPEKKYKYYINGVGYKSIADACRKNGIKHITYNKRIEWGWTQEEALGIKMRENIPVTSLFHKKYHGKKRVKGKEVNIDGKKFQSIAEASRYFKRDTAAVEALVLRGRTLRQALGLDLIETSNLIIYRGKKYANLRALAKKIKINYGLLASRIKDGISVDEAINLGPDHISNEGRYNKKIFQKNPGLASSNGFLYFVSIYIENKQRYKIGITKNSVENRLNQEGHDFTIIKTFKSTLFECYLLEQKLIRKFSNYRDKKIKADQLDGHTEIFDLPKDIVNKIINLIE